MWQVWEVYSVSRVVSHMLTVTHESYCICMVLGYHKGSTDTQTCSVSIWWHWSNYGLSLLSRLQGQIRKLMRKGKNCVLFMTHLCWQEQAMTGTLTVFLLLVTPSRCTGEVKKLL
jgi:hypothetical protein